MTGMRLALEELTDSQGKQTHEKIMTVHCDRVLYRKGMSDIKGSMEVGWNWEVFIKVTFSYCHEGWNNSERR